MQKLFASFVKLITYNFESSSLYHTEGSFSSSKTGVADTKSDRMHVVGTEGTMEFSVHGKTDVIVKDKEGNVVHLLEIIESEGVDVVAACDMQDKLKWLCKKFSKVLTEREQDIIIRRYGLSGEDEVTQRELAKELSISRSYVSRIEKKALEKLKEDFLKAYK